MAKINIYKDHVENKTLQFVLDMASNIHEESLCSDEGNSQEASKADVTDKEIQTEANTNFATRNLHQKGQLLLYRIISKTVIGWKKNSIEVGFGKQSKMEVYVKKVSKERSAVVTSAITKFIVGDMLPVDVVAGDGFKHLMQLTEPG
ncbi:Uncharacterized protein APZ42_008017 [Daphnia magna]|uniref:Uncharacterized protein n=1 Tax=Daphnia magna TaxID=35525 RepID=A0A162BTG2_9CRUS|nr:Uncharacterized protein APZ42_008017 [Daphnia magna]